MVCGVWLRYEKGGLRVMLEREGMFAHGAGAVRPLYERAQCGTSGAVGPVVVSGGGGGEPAVYSGEAPFLERDTVS
jgi:hypothetical protein